jgi:hypothetical protein
LRGKNLSGARIVSLKEYVAEDGLIIRNGSVLMEYRKKIKESTMKNKRTIKTLRRLRNEIAEMESNLYCSPDPHNKAMDYGYRCALLKIRIMIEQKLEKLERRS